MSSEEKIQLLDDKFLECESAKNKAISEIQELNERFQYVVQSLGKDDQGQIESLMGKLKNFLSSTVGTLASIQQNIDQIMNQFVSIQNTFKEMGAR